MNLFRQWIRSIRAMIPDDISGINTLILSVVAGLLMFLLGFYISFPEEVLRLRLQYELTRNLPARVTMTQAEFSFPFGLTAKGVTVKLAEPTAPELTFDSIKLSPHLSSLIGKPGACFEATIGSGRISGSAAQEGALSLEISSLDFDEPLQGFSQLRMSGQISSAQLDSHMQPDQDKPSNMNLLATNLKLSGTRDIGLPLDQLNLGQLELKIDGTGRNFTIKQATLTGGEIMASANGKISVGKNLAATRLNVEMQVKPATTLDPSISTLFELIGSADSNGGRKINLRGTLARPVVR